MSELINSHYDESSMVQSNYQNQYFTTTKKRTNAIGTLYDKDQLPIEDSKEMSASAIPDNFCSIDLTQREFLAHQSIINLDASKEDIIQAKKYAFAGKHDAALLPKQKSRNAALPQNYAQASVTGHQIEIMVNDQEDVQVLPSVRMGAQV